MAPTYSKARSQKFRPLASFVTAHLNFTRWIRTAHDANVAMYRNFSLPSLDRGGGPASVPSLRGCRSGCRSPARLYRLCLGPPAPAAAFASPILFPAWRPLRRQPHCTTLVPSSCAGAEAHRPRGTPRPMSRWAGPAACGIVTLSPRRDHPAARPLPLAASTSTAGHIWTQPSAGRRRRSGSRPSRTSPALSIACSRCGGRSDAARRAARPLLPPGLVC